MKAACTASVRGRTLQRSFRAEYLERVQGYHQTAAYRKALAIRLYNTPWELIEKPDRTKDEDDELLHRAHASRYLWGGVGTAANRARGEWICSRVYAVLGRAEPALHHARRCLELVEAHPAEMEEWDLPAAYEAVARAHSVDGDLEAARRYVELGRQAAGLIADEEDRAPLEADFATIRT